MRPVIGAFLDRLIDTLEHGIRCHNFFDMKIKEFFMMVRWYYSKEEIYDFLYFIISGDTAFSEYVRLRWIYYRNVLEFAESMHMTPKQFSKKFGEVFSTTPYKWMKEGKAKIVHKEITTTDESFKHIADKYGCHSVQQFNKFIKAAFGKTPGEIRKEARKERRN
ncbi:MAG: helix-turn-helix domain-containing protein [Bacteroides sp.]|nr:helix-turn-helix domain-containing protein [Bacteroides sp.]